jgi:hypothetical protein
MSLWVIASANSGGCRGMVLRNLLNRWRLLCVKLRFTMVLGMTNHRTVTTIFRVLTILVGLR